MPYERISIDIGSGCGGRIAALGFGLSGRGPDVVFLHANGFNAMAYRTLLEPLSGAMRILACDQRGHGRTALRAVPEARTDWSDLARDAVALLDGVAGAGVTLVGHSMGGTVALLAAALRPERVRGLVLLDPVVCAPEDRGKGHVGLAEQTLRRRAVYPSRQEAAESYRGRGAFRTWPGEAVDDYVMDGFREVPGGGVELACSREWEASNYNAQGHDAWGALDTLACPVTVLQAASGSSCSLAENPHPRVTVSVIQDTSHFLPFEVPDLVRAVVRRELDGSRE